MAPSGKGKKGPVLDAEFPKDTYAILPNELSDLNEVNLMLHQCHLCGRQLDICSALCTCEGLLHLTKLPSHLRHLLFK